MRPEEIGAVAQAFVAAKIAGRDAFRAGDVPAHNRWWRRADKAARTLIDLGKEGKDAMKALLAHPVPSVQVSAASYVLDWAPEKALPVLEHLLVWAKQDRSGDLFGEAIQVLNNAVGLLAQHHSINVLDVEEHVFARRGRR